MKKVIILSILVMTSINLLGQQGFDKSTFEGIITKCEICDTTEQENLVSYYYCSGGKIVMQASYDNNMQLKGLGDSKIAICHYIYEGKNLIEANTYTKNFLKPAKGFASIKFKYIDGRIAERKEVDRFDNPTGVCPIIRFEYTQDGKVIESQYDEFGDFYCNRDNYPASTKIYTLDSLQRVVEIEYWCRSKRPFKLVAKEIINYNSSKIFNKDVEYYINDSVYVREMTYELPYYYWNY